MNKECAMEFPFQTVYDHFARPIVTMGLKEKMFDPRMFLAFMRGNEIDRITELPHIERFFGSEGGKDTLGMFVRTSMAMVGDMEICMVLMSEAWYKVIPNSDNKPLKDVRPRGSIANDPDSQECIMITIYRPEGTRMGTLYINPDRSLTYSPLHKSTSIGGRLSTHPDREDLPEDLTQH